MKIPLDEAKEKVLSYLIKQGLTTEEATTLRDIVIEQELVGNQFSAIGELSGKHSRLFKNSQRVQEEIVVDKPSAMLIKGNGRMAPLLTAEYLDKAIDKAKNQGIYALGIYDSTYNDFFDIFCRRITSQDCIGIIVENGGPQGVTPFGGKSDVTGTNPIAYGIPTNQSPIIFDAATAAHAYGRIEQARERNENLPENAYVDKDGRITTNPHEAYAVLPFGGFKGYAINLLIDILSGSLVRGKSGLDQPLDSERYIGTFMIIIDPASFGDIDAFKESTTKLANDILAVEPIDHTNPVRVPGHRGTRRLHDLLSQNILEISDNEWHKFTKALNEL